MPKNSKVRSVELEYNDDGTWQINFRLKDEKTKSGEYHYQEPIKMTAVNIDAAAEKIKKFLKGGKDSVKEFKKYMGEDE